MKSFMYVSIMLLETTLLVGCSAATKDADRGHQSAGEIADSATPDYNRVLEALPAPDAVSAYVRRIFQDTKGNLWLGTNGDGVARYDGRSLQYFSIPEGLGGVAVRAIVEDKNGNLWFGTEGGLARYDGESFVTFTEQHGLAHHNVWSILIDDDGLMWVGTALGVSRFDGETFKPFLLPDALIDSTIVSPAQIRIACITQDRRGHVWFGTSGAGAYEYDGMSIRHFTTADGLSDNEVSCILEDRRGVFWFSTMLGGMNTFDGETFTNVSAEVQLSGSEIWNVYEDRLGNIWFPVERAGLYRFDGTSYMNFYYKQGLDSPAIQCTYHDREGRLWAGGYLGLYRLDGQKFVRVAKSGPWK